MRYRQKRPKTWKRVFWGLLGVSVIGLLLPDQITGRLLNLVQVLVPIQAGATKTADRIEDSFDAGRPAVPADEHDQAVEESRALRRSVAALSAEIDDLTEENRVLTRMREGAVGPSGVLIPARLVAGDLLSWRESGLLDVGTLRGVQRNAGVTTRTLGVDVGGRDGAREGMLVLAGEVLVGWVAHAGTHTARVKLLSDPTCRMPVSIGRFEGETFSRLPPQDAAEFWLVGAGAGGLRVIDVDHLYVEGEHPDIAVGDLVLSSPDDQRVPLSLAIGTVSRIEPDPDNGLLYTLTVESAVPERLRHVYVLNLEAR